MKSMREELRDKLLKDDDSMGMGMGSSERHEERLRQYARAEEIASGLVMGTMERDEKVWGYVREIKNNE